VSFCFLGDSRLMSANTAETLAIGERAEAPLFVINLCASTSPMALAHPANPELKKYTFFVTRQREEGRERFRLHMGYFASQDQAEVLLANVRDVYPAAWAGPAPTSGGAPRRARALAAAPVPPAPVAVTPAPAPVPVPVPVRIPEPTVMQAAAAVAPAATLESMSNVRDVLAELSDEAAPAVSQSNRSTVPQLQPPRLQDVPKLQAVEPRQQPSLSASQTLRVLEQKQEPVKVAPAPEMPRARMPLPVQPVPRTEEDQVRVVTPEDTQTLKDIRLDAQNNAPPCFAVQLMWSVSPIDISNFPHLAIFDAYTLYNVEGSRQGRRWYGLRLGFFKNPNAATQVAYYVRSDYQSVAVVPVSNKEREGAGEKQIAAPGARAVASPPLQPEQQTPLEKQGLDGFELLKDDRPVPVKRDVGEVQAAKTATPPATVPRLAPKATGKPTGKRVAVRKRPAADSRAVPGAATPLESTLEILGASTLTLDDSHVVINDSAVRKPVQKKKPGAGGRFARLLNKLGN
jgi:hypothetical protein